MAYNLIYDAASNLKTQTDARGITYSFEYNSYNQIQSKTGPEGVYNYQYVADGIAKHSLKKVVQPNGNFQEYFFDEYGRVKKTREKIAAEMFDFDFEFEFDQWGKLISKKYPNGFTTENEFDNLGNLIKIKNHSSGAAIWTLNTLNEQGKITSSSFGNGASQTKTFTKFGFLETKLDYLSSGTDFLFRYEFDERNGNLNNRKNLSFGVFENFEYENEKLTSASATGGYLQEVDYDFVTKTNIKSKTGVGNYTYHPTKKHAVKNVENTDGAISSNEQNIIFNEQNRAKEIFEGMYKAEFDYSASAHRQSMKMMVTEDPTATNPAYNLSYTRYYLGDYEKEVRGNTTTEVCYINTPIGLTAAYVTLNNTSETYYLHTDHLGSIIGVSNNNQQNIYEISYDAWGKKRPVEFWFPTYQLETPPSWLWRGYTGHEHLEEFALINMNARLYDPILGRMLSPDNYVSDAANSQDYNRYSYARNNPLKYVDPDGNEPVTLAVAASIGAVFGGVAGYKIGQARGAEGWDLFAYTMAGAGIGAGAAVTGAWIGGIIAGTGMGTIVAGTLGGASAGVVSGSGYYTLGNLGTSSFSGQGLWESTWKGAATGAIGGFVSGSVGGALGAFLGGASAGTAAVGFANDWKDVSFNEYLRAAIIGGAIGLAAYEVSTFANWKNNPDGLNYRGYHQRQAIIQRSHAWQAEASWYEMQNGSIKGVRWGDPFGNGVNPAPRPAGGIAYEAHTHVGFGIGNQYNGPTDMSKMPIDAKTSGFGYKVYGWNSNTTFSNEQMRNMPVSMSGQNYKAYYGSNANAAYNQNYAYPNGLPSLGCTTNINFYNSIFFWR